MSVTDSLLKMKNNIILIIGILMISSCYSTHNDERVPEPENLIGKDKIVLILADVEIAESALRQKQNFGHEIGEEKEAYFRSIFTQYGVTREQFDSSMAYYRQDLETINTIYEEVITRLSVIESEVEHE